jgi:hypothetical protein
MVTSNTNKPLGDQEYKGLSTDEKPTDCAINSIFLELDTGDFYYFTGDEETPWVRIGG